MDQFILTTKDCSILHIVIPSNKISMEKRLSMLFHGSPLCLVVGLSLLGLLSCPDCVKPLLQEVESWFKK